MALSKITAASITDNSITNTQINSSAAIAKTKLAALAISNSDIDNSAAIAQSKLATLAITHANLPSGSIVQCVTKTSTNGGEHNNASWTTVHSATNALKITPTSASNKILVQYMMDRGNGAISGESHTLYRILMTIGGSTSAIQLSSAVLNISNNGYRYGAAGSFLGGVFTPNTTSEVQFDIQSYVYSSKKATINPYGLNVGYQAMEIKA
tara:strand:+ start:1138 stop:1767 length:630 start_codon:yes stop_codon:yes gene_type:complete